jgi:hypothetical protein
MFFSAQARKAQIGSLVAFLGPILVYLQATGDWNWRAFSVAVVSGLIAGLSIFYTTNAPIPEAPQLKSTHRHRAPEDEEAPQ